MANELQSPILDPRRPLPTKIAILCDKAFFHRLMQTLDVMVQEEYDWDKYDTWQVLQWLYTMPRGPKRVPKLIFGPTFCKDCGAVLSGHESKRCTRCLGKARSQILAQFRL